MSKLIIVAASLVSLSFAAVSHARTSSDSELRGYNQCLKAAKKQADGLVPSRQYYVQKEGGSAWYFINATQWQDGERANTRIACETSLRGLKLVNATVELGHFATAGSDSLNVANK